MFYVDTIFFDFPCDISRISTIKEGDNSGMLLNGSIKKDPLGTYLSYTVTLVIPLTASYRSKYTQLYEILNSPVSEHTFTFPYNQTTKTFKGYVSSISDKLFREENGVKIWRGTSFTVEMLEPIKKAAD